MQPSAPSPRPSSAPLRAVRRFIETENSGARLLGLAALIALLWANSPLSSAYDELWASSLPEVLTFGGRIADLRHLVNDGAMTLFFLVVGLEIKREMTSGELSTTKKAVLPLVAAIGGMVVPAAIFLTLNAGTPVQRGWGVPIATDIAFAMAVLAIAGPRVPAGLKVFVLSLAIVDDIGAIVAIAVFYAERIELAWLAGALGVPILVAIAGRSRTPPWWLVVPAGIATWTCAVFGGIHPTIAGVLIAMSLPVPSEGRASLEDRLHPWTGLVIIPLFGLANAGVSIDASGLADAVNTGLGAGIVLGLVLGKSSGILLFSWAAVTTGVAHLPPDTTWRSFAGAAAAAGVGFTVSLFIAEQAFSDPAHAQTAKVAILIGSLLSAAIAYALLTGRRRPRSSTTPDHMVPPGRSLSEPPPSGTA